MIGGASVGRTVDNMSRIEFMLSSVSNTITPIPVEPSWARSQTPCLNPGCLFHRRHDLLVQHLLAFFVRPTLEVHMRRRTRTVDRRRPYRLTQHHTSDLLKANIATTVL